jgi:hypothetical protein
VRASAGPRVPVIIVGTHADDVLCTPEFAEATFQRLLRQLGPRYKQNIQTCVPVSCTNGENVDELKKLLTNAVATYCPDAVQSISKHNNSPPRLRREDTFSSMMVRRSSRRRTKKKP